MEVSSSEWTRLPTQRHSPFGRDRRLLKQRVGGGDLFPVAIEEPTMRTLSGPK